MENFKPVLFSAIILSGGRATRMGGVDKGLVQLRNKPFIAHVLERLKPQVDEVFINANRELAQYQAFAYPVLSDEHADFVGPLAGIYLGLKHAKHEYVLAVPCDSPFLPLDLVSRLMGALLAQQAQIAVAKSEGDTHPVCCLCKKDVLPSLAAYLASGGRKVSAWQKSLHCVEVDFSDCASAFLNLNTQADIQALEREAHS